MPTPASALSAWVPRVLLALGADRRRRGGLLDLGRLGRPAAAGHRRRQRRAADLRRHRRRTAPTSGPRTPRPRSPSSTTSSAAPAPTTRSTRSTRWSRSTPAPARRGWSSATSRSPPTTPPWRRSRPRPPGSQERQWQYLDTFFRNQDVARAHGVDEEVLREVAEAVPELDPDQWAEDYRRSGERRTGSATTRCWRPSSSCPPSRRWSSRGPGARRELTDRPSTAEIEAAIAQVSTSD